MHSHSTWILLGAVALAAVFSGCATHSRVDRSWGEGIGHTLSAQVRDSAPDGPLGLDAPTAERVATRYYRGQEAQATRQAATIVIND